ncbi:hypothetical protein BCR35DRAFT_311399 [Leucosporidium creatinivorum]|uniref:Uncharacterized protein n=1 Tax=Leucosporidium creatinivorum TaxID=106004 RepID=A0A1Y2C0T2_9BASI|nr:hypothetical protein BCR35DRAFT_311399 [Leucosporidium creatinivorum]
MDFSQSTAWPALHPPLLTRLPRPPVHPNPASLPPSQRYKSNQFPTLQDEIDQLDWDEDQWINSLHDTRGFGFSWLVPLGRQNTQEEDAESAFSSSPRATSAEPLPDEAAQPNGINGDASMEGAEVVDLDADIEDADADATVSGSEEEEDEEEGSGSEAGTGSGTASSQEDLGMRSGAGTETEGGTVSRESRAASVASGEESMES